MSDLPEGWVETTLGAHIRGIKAGKNLRCIERPPRKNERGIVKVSAVTYGTFDPTQSKTLPAGFDPDADTQIRTGDFLFSRANTVELVGACTIVAATPDNLFLSDKILRLEIEHEWKVWIERFLKSPNGRNALEAASSGNQHSMRNISQTALKSISIPIPPLAEQRRIVEKLDALSAQSRAAATALTRIETLITRYKAAVLGTIFDRIDAPIITIGDISKRVTKGASPKWQGFHYQEDGILFVRSQNVLWGSTDLSSRAYLDKSFNDKQSNSIIEEGDILLNIVGASIGRSAIATEAMVGANCNQAVAVIKLSNPRASSKYLMNWLLSPSAQKAIHDGSVDVARANFSLAGIKSLQLPWPPLEEQAEIVARIEAAFAQIETLACAAAAARARLGALDRAILARAFQGKLVPQNPSDEPASELLERLRAAR